MFPRVVRNRVEGRYDPVRFNRASHDAFRVYPRAFSVLPEKCQYCMVNQSAGFGKCNTYLPTKTTLARHTMENASSGGNEGFLNHSAVVATTSRVEVTMY